MNWSQEKFYKAYLFAAEAHNGQNIPGSNLPYIVHVSQVCVELMCIDDTDIRSDFMLTCAALHDVLEDTKITYEAILSVFGEEVAEAVKSLSKNKELPKDLQIGDSLVRIKKQTKEIWMIKMADRIINLNPPPSFWTQEKKKKYMESSYVIYDELKSSNKFLGDRLLTKIKNYNLYI